MFPPVMRSPIRECCTKAMKYGIALFLYTIRKGMKTVIAEISE